MRFHLGYMGFVLCASIQSTHASTWLVDQNATGQNLGTSWEDAFWDLQVALAVAQPGDEIWIAKGNYKPDRGTGDRTLEFQIPCDVSIYGGFAGFEHSLEERDLNQNETVLSGDLNDDDGERNCWEVSNCCQSTHSGPGCDDPLCESMVCDFKPECCQPQDLDLDPDYWGRYCAPLAAFACCHLGSWRTCEDSYRTVAIEGCENVLIDGVVVVGGYHDWVRDGEVFYPVNGSIVSQDASYTVSRSTFRGHATSGLFAESRSHLVLEDCFFQERSAHVRGGALKEDRSTVTVDGCRFESASFSADRADTILRNSSLTADWTSASISNASASVESCDFRDTAGLSLFAVDCTVSNSSFHGAGRVHFSSTSGTIDNCSFVGGSGRGASGGVSSVLFRNCLFLHNANSAISWSGGALYILNCTIVGNGFENFPGGVAGGAIYFQQNVSAQVLNSILWGNGWGHSQVENNQIVVRPQFNEALEIDDSIVEGWSGQLGGPTSTNNSGLDPMFVDTDGIDGIPGTEDDNGRVLPGSPAIDAGFESVYLNSPDLDGHARVLCGQVDIGAYEFGIGDFNCDDHVDLLDHAAWDACMTNPRSSAVRPGCEAFDYNADSDIDLADFAAQQRAATSAFIPQ